MSSTENRRQHPRFAISLSVEIFTGADAVPAIAKNLSQGGLGVSLGSQLPKGQQVGLSLFLCEDGIEDERSAPANMRGEICWCTPEPGGFAAGIRFLELKPEHLGQIQAFLDRLTRQR
jgi:hypothetical protein